jgi:hypothetical protein
MRCLKMLPKNGEHLGTARKTEPRPPGSARGPARTAKRIRNRPAPHSVLREFLQSAIRTREQLATLVVALPAGRSTATPSKALLFVAQRDHGVYASGA